MLTCLFLELKTTEKSMTHHMNAVGWQIMRLSMLLMWRTIEDKRKFTQCLTTMHSKRQINPNLTAVIQRASSSAEFVQIFDWALSDWAELGHNWRNLLFMAMTMTKIVLLEVNTNLEVAQNEPIRQKSWPRFVPSLYFLNKI